MIELDIVIPSDDGSIEYKSFWLAIAECIEAKYVEDRMIEIEELINRWKGRLAENFWENEFEGIILFERERDLTHFLLRWS